MEREGSFCFARSPKWRRSILNSILKKLYSLSPHLSLPKVSLTCIVSVLRWYDKLSCLVRAEYTIGPCFKPPVNEATGFLGSHAYVLNSNWRNKLRPQLLLADHRAVRPRGSAIVAEIAPGLVECRHTAQTSTRQQAMTPTQLYATSTHTETEGLRNSFRNTIRGRDAK